MEIVVTFFAEHVLLLNMLIALLLGLFIGLRREIDIQGGNADGFVGFRTMPLIVMLGALSVSFDAIPYLPLLVLLGLLVFLWIAYYNGVFKLSLIGLTSEFSTVVMFLVGVLVGTSQYIEAIVLTVVVGVLSGFKRQLHSFASGISLKEWSGALQLLVLSAVILPFLPQQAIDPLGVIVPFDIWLLVIFISGIGFVGYFLNKYLEAHHGLVLTSFLGSLVSSTAVTTALAIQANKQREIPKQLFIIALMVSVATMLMRTILTILVLAPGELRIAVFIPMTMLVATGFVFLILMRTKRDIEVDVEPELTSPFEIMPAIKFGALFVVVLLAVALGKKFLGDSGVYITAFFSAFVDVDATILSSIQSARIDQISMNIALTAIGIGVVVNTAVKAGYVWILSRRDVAIANAGIIGFISLVGCCALFLI